MSGGVVDVLHEDGLLVELDVKMVIIGDEVGHQILYGIVIELSEVSGFAVHQFSVLLRV